MYCSTTEVRNRGLQMQTCMVTWLPWQCSHFWAHSTSKYRCHTYCEPWCHSTGIYSETEADVLPQMIMWMQMFERNEVLWLERGARRSNKIMRNKKQAVIPSMFWTTSILRASDNDVCIDVWAVTFLSGYCPESYLLLLKSMKVPECNKGLFSFYSRHRTTCGP